MAAAPAPDAGPGPPKPYRLFAELRELPRPEVILLISAHWEAPSALFTAGAQPELMFDYAGFPPHTYQYRYPAPAPPSARPPGLSA